MAQAFIFCIGKLEERKINEIFNYLYEIYLVTKTSSNSIISKEIKLFSNAFENLCRSLKGSEVDLNEFKDLPNLKENDNIIINEEKPSPKAIKFQSGIYWKGKNSYSRNELKLEEEKEIKIIMDEEIISKPTTVKTEEKKDIIKKPKEKPKALTNKVDFEKVIGKGYDIIEDNSENEDEKETEIIHFKKIDVIAPMKSEEINKLKAISVEGVTKRIIKKMFNKNIAINLKLPETFPEFKSKVYGDRDNILKKQKIKKKMIL